MALSFISGSGLLIMESSDPHPIEDEIFEDDEFNDSEEFDDEVKREKVADVVAKRDNNSDIYSVDVCACRCESADVLDDDIRFQESDSDSDSMRGGYQNLMWNPRVNRGPTFKDFRSSNDPNNDRIVNFNKYCCKVKQPSGASKLTKTGKKKKRRFITPTKTFGGIIRPTTEDVLALSSKEIGFGNQEELSQFLEEQLPPITHSEGGAQTDEIDFEGQQERLRNSPYCRQQEGKDAQCQVFYRELISYDEEAGPVVNVTTTKIIEQSFLEVMEEEEQKLAQGHRIELEKDYLNTVKRYARLEERQQDLQNQMIVLRDLRAQEMISESETVEQIGARRFSMTFLKTFLVDTMEVMRIQKMLPINDHDIEYKIIPWLSRRVMNQMMARNTSAMLIDDVLNSVAIERLTGHSDDQERRRLSELLKKVSISNPNEVYFLNPEAKTSSQSIEDEDESGVDDDEENSDGDKWGYFDDNDYKVKGSQQLYPDLDDDVDNEDDANLNNEIDPEVLNK